VAFTVSAVFYFPFRMILYTGPAYELLATVALSPVQGVLQERLELGGKLECHSVHQKNIIGCSYVNKMVSLVILLPNRHII
jgi:hypothetical protein